MRRFTLALLTAIPLLGGTAEAQMPAAAFSSNPAFAAFGGQPGIAKVVDGFVTYLLADSRIKGQFADANIPRLRKLLTEQFCVLLGGNCTYEGRSMAETHAAMGLRNADFNALAEDLQFAMDDQKIPFSDQNVLLKQLAPMQHDIVTK